MKKYALLLLVALFAFSCAQDKKQDEKQDSILSGKVENLDNGLITLVGTEFEKDIILEEDGTFSSILELPYDGYYNVIFGRVPLPMYLEQGKNLSINIDLQDIGSTLTFSEDLAPENDFLTQKREIAKINPRELYEKEPDDFTASINELVDKLSIVLEDSEIANKNFLASQKKELLYQKASYLNTYENAYTYLTEKEEVNLPSNFYASLEEINMADTLEFRLSDVYKQMVQGYLFRTLEEMPSAKDTNDAIRYIELVNETFPESYAKNQLLKEAVGHSLKPDKHLDKAYELYMNSQTDPLLKQEMEDKYAVLSKITPGNKSPEFDYENFKGGTTSLESLRGKYVYIDVWATWCGPCLREIPYLIELEKDYQDKNVQIVGISIDEEKAYNKWKTMLTEEESAGIQLYSGGDAWRVDFAQGYNVRSIPRFILIDPEGNIFDADTYRPSDPKIRELFDEIL